MKWPEPLKAGTRENIAERIKSDVNRMMLKDMGRNEIARELNVSPRHVTAASRLLGLKFDDSGIRDALEARRTRHQDRMSKIAEEFAKAAEQRLEELKKVTPGDAHKLTLAAAIATDKAQQLWAKYDDGDPTLGDDTLEGE